MRIEAACKNGKIHLNFVCAELHLGYFFMQYHKRQDEMKNMHRGAVQM